MKGKRLSKEEKLAIKMSEIVSDVHLDLEELGKTIANSQPTLTYNRFILVAEAAVEEKQNAGNRIYY